jgi:thiol-disulfide isomerase/thioredoxin
LKKQYLIRIVLLCGLVLSVISELDICGTSACAETHKYVLFGLPFTLFGIAFFLAAWAVFELGRTRRMFSALFVVMVSASGGAEVAFMRIQKYVIQDWCPLCIGIAAAVYVLAGLSYFADVKNFIIKRKERRETAMGFIKKVFIIVLVVIAGFLTAYTGTKRSEAHEKSPNVFLGKAGSDREIYIFTDWFCPACRKAEPEIEKAVSSAVKTAKIIFIDVPVHPETFNYIPYNLSFLTHEKGTYLELRKALEALSLRSKEPGPAEVQKEIAPLHVTYKPLAFMAVAEGMKYFDETTKAFGIKSTPTVVVLDSKTKKRVKMVGSRDITEQNIMKALDEVSK